MAKILQKHPDADANKDGVLTPEEWHQYRQTTEAGKTAGTAQLKDKKDKSSGPSDQKLSHGSVGVLDLMLAHFEQIDTDGNGQLSKEEIAAFRAKLIERGPAGLTGGAPGAEGHGSRGEFAAALLKSHPEADTDKDGKLSPAEMKAFVEKNPEAVKQFFLERHPEADTNKDGQLSDEEFQAAREKLHGQGRGNQPAGQNAAPAAK